MLPQLSSIALVVLGLVLTWTVSGAQRFVSITMTMSYAVDTIKLATVVSIATLCALQIVRFISQLDRIFANTSRLAELARPMPA